jgi:hypothetical protein
MLQHSELQAALGSTNLVQQAYQPPLRQLHISPPCQLQPTATSSAATILQVHHLGQQLQHGHPASTLPRPDLVHRSTLIPVAENSPVPVPQPHGPV